MRKIFISFGLLVIGLAIIAALALLLLRHSNRHYDQHLHSPYGDISLHWDNAGVPHIQAQTDDLAAFYALGFVHAQDRLWQMELQRYTAQGRLGEIFGKRMLKKDQYLRSWKFYAAAKQDWQHYDKFSQAIVTSYTQGINAAIKVYGLSLPFYLLGHRAELWTEVDALCWQKLMAWDLESTWEKKVSRAQHAEKTNHHHTLIHAQAPLLTPTAALRQSLHFENFMGKGSNSWVLSGNRTQSGKPILANDIHLALTVPSLVYLAELRGPNLQVIGATLPGLPGIIIGHNQHIAWGLTNSYVDTQDLYIVTPQNVQTHDEIIRLKGAASVHYKTYTSEQGPIISTVTQAKDIAPWVAIKWPALSGKDTTIAGFLHLNYAQNWAQFLDAIKYFVAPVQNIVYADTSGHIGYYMPGKIPIRHGFDGSIPVPDDAQYHWQGYIPFDQLPQQFDPASDLIITANNQVAGKHYPYPLTAHGYMPPYRAQRIKNLIQTHQKLSLRDNQTIQLDIYSSIWPLLKNQLLAVQGQSPKAQQALARLAKWSGRMERQSIGASIFAAWYHEIDNVIEEPLAETKHTEDPFFVEQQLQHNGPACKTNSINSCQQLLTHALQRALQKLTQTLGPNLQSWQWGRLHRLQLEDKVFSKISALRWLWTRNIATGGGKYTVNVATYNQNYRQLGGATYRQVIDLSNFSNSRYIIPLGQVENPLNQHFDNLLTAWQQGQYLKMRTYQ